MPQSHRNVFTYISAFLRELLLHSNDNKLDAKTLGKLTFSMFLLSLTLTVDMIKKETNRATHTYARFVARARTYFLAFINPLVHYFAQTLDDCALLTYLEKSTLFPLNYLTI